MGKNKLKSGIKNIFLFMKKKTKTSLTLAGQEDLVPRCSKPWVAGQS